MSSRGALGTTCTASTPTASVYPIASRPPRPTKSEAGRRLNARNAKQLASNPRATVASAVLTAETGEREESGGRRGAQPGGEAVDVPETVGGLGDHHDEAEREHHVEHVDAGGAEARARDHRDHRRDHRGGQREPVGTLAALHHHADDSQEAGAHRGDHGELGG